MGLIKIGQSEILNILSKKPHKWFTIYEIKEELKSMGLPESNIKRTHNKLFQLSAYNLIKCKGVGIWNHVKVFKYKNGDI